MIFKSISCVSLVNNFLTKVIDNQKIANEALKQVDNVLTEILDELDKHDSRPSQATDQQVQQRTTLSELFAEIAYRLKLYDREANLDINVVEQTSELLELLNPAKMCEIKGKCLNSDQTCIIDMHYVYYQFDDKSILIVSLPDHTYRTSDIEQYKVMTQYVGF